MASYVLYSIGVACWLPVIRLQMRVRDLAYHAVATSASLPAEYGRCMRLWFGLGWPVFAAIVAIFWLMVHKPELW